MYIVIITTILLILSLLEYKHKLDKKYILATFIILDIFLISRYPVGMDVYDMYMNIYLGTNFVNLTGHGYITRSPLYLLIWIINYHFLGNCYNNSLLVLNLINIPLWLYTIHKNSNLKIFSLFIMMASGIAQIYFISAFRQCLAMTFFFFGYFNFLREKKYFKYLIFAILSAMCHEVGYIGLSVLIVELLLNKFDILNDKKVIMGLGLIALLVAIFSSQIIDLIYPYMGHFQLYIYDLNVINRDYLGIALRLILLLGMFILYMFVRDDKKKKYSNTVYFYYLITLVYIAFSWIDSASRFIDYFAIVEVICIPNMIMDMKKVDSKYMKYFIIFVVIGYISVNYVMLVDDINYFCNYVHGAYNFFNYPFYLIYKYLGSDIRLY